MDLSAVPGLIQNLLNDQSSYPFIAILFILGFLVIRKIIKMVTFVVIFGGMALALSALQGQDISKFTGPALAYITDIFNQLENKVGDATGNKSAGNSNADGEDVRQMLNDTFAKKK